MLIFLHTSSSVNTVFLLQCLRKVSKFIAEQNERVYHPRGLIVTDPSLRGLRVLEISCLDRPPNA